jgi:hypothetical protein
MHVSTETQDGILSLNLFYDRNAKVMRLFISYARVDQTLVRKVVDLLTKGDHDPWYDEHLQAGERWKDQILTKIRQQDVFIYLLTPQSARSEYCLWEYREALSRDKPILPVLLQKDTKFPPGLDELQYVDFTDGFSAESTARLLGGLSGMARKLPARTAKAIAQTLPTEPRGIPAGVDELYEDAAKLAFDHDGISLGILKRELHIGYERAKRLMELLQAQGVVGEYPGGSKLHPLI